MKNSRASKFLFLARNYVIIFLMNCFVITCCLILFLQDLEYSKITQNAIATFINVAFLSLILTLLYAVSYHMMVEKPVRSLMEATQKIVKGDFHVRIERSSQLIGNNELNAVIDNFNEMAEELAGTEVLRSDFIANVSHELKTPLALIHNYSELMNTEQDVNKLKEYAKSINEASGNLSAMITNILKLNRLENQKIYLETQKYNLSEQLTQSLLGFETIFEEKNIEIEADIDEDIMIEADEEMLMIVWNNLFSNAFKFTQEHGTVRVHAHQSDQKVIVSVSDTGCGMSPEVGKHIFEKFYQGDTSHATKGNGLGLALVKRIVELMQASISVESTLGEGTTFTVELDKQQHEKN